MHNYQREIGYGLLYGYYQDIKFMEIGQHLEKLMLWNLEEMKIIHNLMEVDHQVLEVLFIGDLIGLKINSQKLMNNMI